MFDTDQVRVHEERDSQYAVTQQQNPAPLTALEQLVVSPVVQDHMFVRVVGVHVSGAFGGSHRVAREGHIDIHGPVSVGIDGW